MKTALLFFSLAVISYPQTRLPGQCGGSSAIAVNPEVSWPGAPSPQIDSAASRSPHTGSSTGFAAKPENSRPNARPVLPQIRYRRPPGVPHPSCWCGTVAANSLTSAGPSQEVPIVSALSGDFRFDYILIQETARFSSDLVSSLVVAAGLPDTGGDLVPEFALMSQTAPQNFVYEIPEPPLLTGTYNLVLKFAGSSPLAIAGSSNFASGSVNWEVCGHQVH